MMAALTLMPSCAGDPLDDIAPSLPAPRFNLGMEISLNGNDSGLSRAPSDAPHDPGYLPGSGFENYVDVDDMAFAIYDADTDQLLGQILDYTLVPLETSESSKRYYLNIATHIDVSSGRFKLLMLANWGHNYPADLSLRNIWAKTFNWNNHELSKDNIIPLYGIKEVNIEGGIAPETRKDIGILHLIRGVAKIEVVLDDKGEFDDFWHFKTLQLTRYNKSGHNAPAVSSQDDYVKESWYEDYLTEPYIPGDVQAGEALDFVPVDSHSFVLYVPEYDNTTAGVQRAQIRAEFIYSDNGELSIDFLNEKKEIIDIHRNVWYRITIKKKPETTDVEFKVDVVPYRGVVLEPDFGFDD